MIINLTCDVGWGMNESYLSNIRPNIFTNFFIYFISQFIFYRVIDFPIINYKIHIPTVYNKK